MSSSVTGSRAFAALERLSGALAAWTRVGDPVMRYWYLVVAKALREGSDEPGAVATYDSKSNTLHTNAYDDDFSRGVLSAMVPLGPVTVGVLVLELIDFVQPNPGPTWAWAQLLVIIPVAAVMLTGASDLPTESGGFRIESIDGGDG